MKKNAVFTLVLFLCLGFFSPTAKATLMLSVQGQVETIEEAYVTIRTQATMIRVPRRTIQSTNLRPGQWVTAVVDSKSPIKTWGVKGMTSKVK